MYDMIDKDLSINDLGDIEWALYDKNKSKIRFKCNFSIMEFNNHGNLEHNIIVWMDPDLYDIDKQCTINPANFIYIIFIGLIAFVIIWMIF